MLCKYVKRSHRLTRPMDSIDNYQVGELLGKGGFASVYKARCINSGEEVAIKMVDKQQMFR